MDLAPPGSNVVGPDGRATRAWASWITRASIIISGVSESGTTANRPTTQLWVGRMYFDTTLGKPVWYEGPGWVDATGASA